jgi:hypothetical protein
MWRAILRWNAASRQRRTGWLILTISLVYIFYFLKARLLAGGEPVVTKEWVYFALSFIGIMIGTINIRMADMRERNQKTMPLLDPDKIQKR